MRTHNVEGSSSRVRVPESHVTTGFSGDLTAHNRTDAHGDGELMLRHRFVRRNAEALLRAIDVTETVGPVMAPQVQ